jgi:MFS family permease
VIPPLVAKQCLPPIRVLLTARGVRAVADGLISLVLPVYLGVLGHGPLQIGIIATATLAGSAVLTLATGFHAHRTNGKFLLIGMSILMATTGLLFAQLESYWPLLVVAFVGTLNPSAGDVSAFLPAEQAQLADLASPPSRTALFARYSFVGSMGSSIGALAAALPQFSVWALGISLKSACQAAFVAYAAAGLVVLLLYSGLPAVPSAPSDSSTPLGPSRQIVFRLAALFSLDSFASGFVVQSLLALWLFQRFGLSLVTVGSLFFWTGVLSAFSQFLAVWISKRIGLVNTMVFTHIPANVCLLLTPFASNVWIALGLLLIRSALSQMDVPARTSYVMSVVSPAERAAAASFTAVPRSLASAASPTLAGLLLAGSGFGWFLVVGGGLKIVYDLLLLATFRSVPIQDDR